MSVTSPMIATMFGPRRASAPPGPVHVVISRRELAMLAAAIDRDADAAEADGRAADSRFLAWRAATIREAGR